MPANDRKSRARIRRIERVLSNYERERERLDSRMVRLRQEKEKISGVGFPLMTLASSLLKDSHDSPVARIAQDFLAGKGGRWTNNLNKLELELRKIQSKTDEISKYVVDFQNTLSLIVSGLSMLTGTGGGMLLQKLLPEPDGERETDQAYSPDDHYDDSTADEEVYEQPVAAGEPIAIAPVEEPEASDSGDDQPAASSTPEEASDQRSEEREKPAPPPRPREQKKSRPERPRGEQRGGGGLNMDTLLEIASSPKFQALSKEILSRLGR